MLNKNSKLFLSNQMFESNQIYKIKREKRNREEQDSLMYNEGVFQAFKKITNINYRRFFFDNIYKKDITIKEITELLNDLDLNNIEYMD